MSTHTLKKHSGRARREQGHLFPLPPVTALEVDGPRSVVKANLNQGACRKRVLRFKVLVPHLKQHATQLIVADACSAASNRLSKFAGVFDDEPLWAEVEEAFNRSRELAERE